MQLHVLANDIMVCWKTMIRQDGCWWLTLLQLREHLTWTLDTPLWAAHPNKQTQKVREERLSVSVLSFGFDSLICQHPSPEQMAFPAIPALCPDEHQWANPAGHGLLYDFPMRVLQRTVMTTKMKPFNIYLFKWKWKLCEESHYILHINYNTPYESIVILFF